jgi:hypothetical protein
MTHSKAIEDNTASLREQLRQMVEARPAAEQDLFRRMYDHKGKCEHPVYNIPPEKLDWAFMQVENAIKTRP